MSSTPDRPISPTNELAKERNRAAAERTMTSWIQNSIALIGFGIAFERIFNALNETLPANPPAVNIIVSEAIGLGAIGFGLFILWTAVIGYLKAIQRLEQEDYLYRTERFSSLFLIMAGSIILFGVISLIAIFTVPAIR
jgi:putative membrane protein